jgi:hypothetical protein
MDELKIHFPDGVQLDISREDNADYIGLDPKFTQNEKYTMPLTHEKLVPDIESYSQEYKKKLADYTYGNIDLRNAKHNDLFPGVSQKIYQRVALSSELIADCSTEIDQTANQFIKSHRLFVSNRGYNLDHNKWFMVLPEKSKYLVFGKYVGVDINENFYFEAMKLSNAKDRQAKLAVIKEWHDAVKSGVRARMEYALDVLNREYRKYLWDLNVDLITEVAHSIYWYPVNLGLLPIYERYFGTRPLEDWLLYPWFFEVRHNFSANTPDKSLIVGPPINLSQKQPYPGRMLIQVGCFVEYTNSLFGGKITLTRHGKSY